MKVCLGGTFNSIHRGHAALIGAAFLVSDDVEIGLSSDALASKKQHPVKPYAERKRQLDAFLKSRGWSAKIRQITDVYGFAAEKEFEAIVVSEETLDNAYLINVRRAELGLPGLKIVTIPIIKDAKGQKLSSGD